jgi:NAD-dependent DNA ligase
MAPSLNPDGQPLVPFVLNRIANERKSIDALIGFARCALADGVVSDAEALEFHRWVLAMRATGWQWPIDEIAQRLETIFADGAIDPAEREDLRDIMEQLGAAPSPHGVTVATLPLDEPPPALVFPGATFCVTGKFAFGTRAKVHAAITGRGGVAGERVTSDTSYLVIGAFASRDWAHTSYGRKIEQAVDLRRGGQGLAIVGEDHWRSAINS